MDKILYYAKIVGIIMILAGIVINYLISRRRFNRRTITGLQAFKTYEQAWTTRLLESTGKLIAIALIIAGTLLLIGTFLPMP